MSYRLTYEAWIQWVGPGAGPMSGAIAPIRGSEQGGAQVLMVPNLAGGQNITGTGTGGALAGADITTITNAMAADVAAQLNTAAVSAITTGWPTGNP